MPEPILRDSPLSSVICEFRFQEASNPLRVVEFAADLEQLGFGEYAREEGFEFQLGPVQMDRQTVERHRFIRTDGSAAFTVADDLFSYEDRSYQGIDGFLGQWASLASITTEHLAIGARTRLGLRYINEIPLDGDDLTSVSSAINPDLLRPWGTEPELQNLTVSLHELRFKQDQGGEITFRHGLQRIPARPPSYLLDFDHYEQRLAAVDVSGDVKSLRAFNERVHRIFRWSITDDKYLSFGPAEQDG